MVRKSAGHVSRSVSQSVMSVGRSVSHVGQSVGWLGGQLSCGAFGMSVAGSVGQSGSRLVSRSLGQMWLLLGLSVPFSLVG